jgi:aryl-alcohol dehydrogenase-like predicted oxidoreductase
MRCAIRRLRTGLSTKVGRLLRAMRSPPVRLERRHPLPFDVVYDYSHDGIRRSFEESLQRLGLARIDILYVHDIGASTVVGGPFDSGILAGCHTWNYDTARRR